MPIDVTLSPPSSQSIAKRAFLCAALAEGNSILEGSFHSQDLQVMVNALREIGLTVLHAHERHQPCQLEIARRMRRIDLDDRLE